MPDHYAVMVYKKGKLHRFITLLVDTCGWQFLAATALSMWKETPSIHWIGDELQNQFGWDGLL
jgi:uncharacterized protein (DUF2132 family)